MTTITFPEGFHWGTATAAFQIEGASTADGRGDSIWDVFCRQPGKVANGDDGSVACDFYHRYPQDFALMAELGLKNFRFSTSWARIMPDGRTLNPAGLDFYDRVVDEMLSQGITPWLTLYHWDLPAAIEGGWTSRATADMFADYAVATFERLGDRVKNWLTLNEPWCSSLLSYADGEHAPGHRDPVEACAAVHHLLLAHGKAIQALRPLAGEEHQLGITLNFTVAHPANPEDENDLDAVRRIEGTSNRLFLDPIFRGEYPADVLVDMAKGKLEQNVQDGDLEVISEKIDWLGVNFYNGCQVAALDPSLEVEHSPNLGSEQVRYVPRGLPLTEMGWEVYAPDMRELMNRLHRDYTGPAGIPLVITENGAAYDDQVDASGEVHDPERVDYLRGHIGAVGQAIADGADIAGYFAWSFLDNFEWSWGYDRRFGIVHVDYQTQKRTPKSSAHFFAEVARANAVES